MSTGPTTFPFKNKNSTKIMSDTIHGTEINTWKWWNDRNSLLALALATYSFDEEENKSPRLSSHTFQFRVSQQLARVLLLLTQKKVSWFGAEQAQTAVFFGAMEPQQVPPHSWTEWQPKLENSVSTFLKTYQEREPNHDHYLYSCLYWPAEDLGTHQAQRDLMREQPDTWHRL